MQVLFYIFILRVVGPRCLACCLTEGIAIPSGPEPVYTVAMRDLMVTASGLTKEKKVNINIITKLFKRTILLEVFSCVLILDKI